MIGWIPNELGRNFVWQRCFSRCLDPCGCTPEAVELEYEKLLMYSRNRGPCRTTITLPPVGDQPGTLDVTGEVGTDAEWPDVPAERPRQTY